MNIEYLLFESEYFQIFLKNEYLDKNKNNNLLWNEAEQVIY